MVCCTGEAGVDELVFRPSNHFGMIYTRDQYGHVESRKRTIDKQGVSQENEGITWRFLSIWTSGRGVIVRGEPLTKGEIKGLLAFGELLFEERSRGDGGVVSPVVTISRCVTFKVPIYLGINGSTTISQIIQTKQFIKSRQGEGLPVQKVDVHGGDLHSGRLISMS